MRHVHRTVLTCLGLWEPWVSQAVWAPRERGRAVVLCSGSGELVYVEYPPPQPTMDLGKLYYVKLNAKKASGGMYCPFSYIVSLMLSTKNKISSDIARRAVTLP